jgi:hypothetical protein
MKVKSLKVLDFFRAVTNSFSVRTTWLRMADLSYRVSTMAA